MVAVPTLTDGVVTLRAHRDSDIERCVEQCVDPLSIQWTTVPQPYTRDDAATFVRHVMPGGWVSDEEWGFAIEHEGVYAGTISLRNRGERRAEIAYGSHPDVRGRGVMERAVRLLLEWGFHAEGRDLETVIWWANAYNWASRRLAWKVGFSFDGLVRGWLPHRGELVDAWVGTLRRGDERVPAYEWLDVPRIVGKNVVLRRHRPEDEQRVLEGCTDERTAYWLGHMVHPFTAEDAAGFLLRRNDGMASGLHLHWVVADPDDDRLLGTISVLHIRLGEGEIGYWAHPEARGRGVMSEAARLAVRHSFIDRADGGLGLRRLRLLAAVDNAASRHVAEASGFVLEGIARDAAIIRGGFQDAALYGQVRP